MITNASIRPHAPYKSTWRDGFLVCCESDQIEQVMSLPPRLLAQEIYSQQTIIWALHHLKAFHDRVVDIATFADLEGGGANSKHHVSGIQSSKKLCIGFCLASVSS